MKESRCINTGRALMKDWRFRDMWGSSDIKSDLIEAGGWVATAIVIGLVVGLLLGWVGPTLPVSWGKLANLVGLLLNAVATWFALAHICETWDGGSVDEVWRPRVFKLLLFPGVALQTIGAL